jgi:hypothetical protein
LLSHANHDGRLWQLSLSAEQFCNGKILLPSQFGVVGGLLVLDLFRRILCVIRQFL